MIHLVRDLYNLGLRIGTDLFSDVRVYYTFELTDANPVFKIKNDSPVLKVPFQAGRTSGVKPYHLHDNLKYYLRLDKRGNSFWDQLLVDSEEIGHNELRQAIVRCAELSQTWKSEVAHPGRDDKELYWYVWSGRKPTKVEVKKKLTNPAKAPAGIVSDSAWIVPTFNGIPVVEMPEVIAWWQSKSTEQMGGEGAGSSLDLVTGKRCNPVALHDKVRGVPKTGGAFPLISFNEQTYCFDNMVQGDNFPVSVSTSRTYTSGLNFLLDKNKSKASTQVSDDLVLSFWPRENGTTHPIIPLACAVLGEFLKEEDLQATWKALEEVDVTDDVLLSFLFLKGAQARISILNYEYIRVSELKRNLLQFKEEFTEVRPSFRTMVSFKKDERSKAMIPNNYIPAVLLAVVFGRRIPHQLSSYLNTFNLSDDSARFIMAWNEVTVQRRSMYV